MKLGALLPQLRDVAKDIAVQRHDAIMTERTQGDLLRNVRISFEALLYEALWKAVPCNTCTHALFCRVAKHGGTVQIAAHLCRVQSHE